MSIDLCAGVHLSLGPHPAESLAAAAAQEARCVQIFASSPGAWKPPVIDGKRATEVRDRGEYGIGPLFIHAIYLINLASQDPALVARSRASLTATLRAGKDLGATALVTHIGSHAGRGFEAVAGQIAEQLVAILMATEGTIDLLLENSAGAGGIVGSTIEELAELLDRAGRPERLGVALDTAHLCGAGWDLAAPGEANRLVAEIEERVGAGRLRLIHANDSKVPCGTRRDRHANVGEGYIGLDGFRALLRHPLLTHIPWIVETPDLGSATVPEKEYGSLHTLLALAAESEGSEGDRGS